MCPLATNPKQVADIVANNMQSYGCFHLTLLSFQIVGAFWTGLKTLLEVGTKQLAAAVWRFGNGSKTCLKVTCPFSVVLMRCKAS
jgi:hypothetical protein